MCFRCQVFFCCSLFQFRLFWPFSATLKHRTFMSLRRAILFFVFALRHKDFSAHTQETFFRMCGKCYVPRSGGKKNTLVFRPKNWKIGSTPRALCCFVIVCQPPERKIFMKIWWFSAASCWPIMKIQFPATRVAAEIDFSLYTRENWISWLKIWFSLLHLNLEFFIISPPLTFHSFHSVSEKGRNEIRTLHQRNLTKDWTFRRW